jgi:hypothetical protein
MSNKINQEKLHTMLQQHKAELQLAKSGHNQEALLVTQRHPGRQQNSKPGQPHKQQPPQHAATSKPMQEQKGKAGDAKERPYCSYCHKPYHTREECYKQLAKLRQVATANASKDKKILTLMVTNSHRITHQQGQRMVSGLGGVQPHDLPEELATRLRTNRTTQCGTQ